MRLARLFVTLAPEQACGLLLEVSRHLDGGFSEAEAKVFYNDLVAVGVGEDGLVEPIVRFEGAEQPLVISIFKETANSLSAAFIASDQLIAKIQERIRASLGDEMSVQLISASASREAQ